MAVLGKYIAIEGLDGSGKSTLFNNLIVALDKQGTSYSKICPTKAIKDNSIIEQLFIKSKFLSKLSFFRAIVYANRSFVASKNVNWASDLIIGDRSILTSYVTRWRKWFNCPFLSILFVNTLEPFVKPPDYIIYLTASTDILQKRLSNREFIDIDETPSRSDEMRKAYEEIKLKQIIKRLKNSTWIELDANQDPSILTEKALRIINEIKNGVQSSRRPVSR
jgi:thymidylate kinase